MKPTTNNLEGWEMDFHQLLITMPGVSLLEHQAIWQLIKDIRKHDEEMLIKRFRGRDYLTPTQAARDIKEFYNK